MHAVRGAGRVLAGRYLLEDPIGRGAMGIVWRGRDKLLHRDVAIKEVQIGGPALPADADSPYERTLREARAAARLSHPSVVTIFDIVEEQGSPWIVMELVGGRSLDRLIAEDGPLPPRQAAELGTALLGALSAAHAAGVLHRDVKPGNVLVTPQGRAVLTDFGIAIFEGDGTQTQSGLVVGTPGFTAPERVRGHGATPASDLWSLGATLYAAVEGRGPFDRPGGATAVSAGVAAEDPPRARSAGPLAPVIHALLRRDPAGRPDAATAASLLAEVAADTPGPRPGWPESVSAVSSASAEAGGAGRADGAAAGDGAGGADADGVSVPGGPEQANRAARRSFLDPPVYAELRMPDPVPYHDALGVRAHSGSGADAASEPVGLPAFLDPPPAAFHPPAPQPPGARPPGGRLPGQQAGRTPGTNGPAATRQPVEAQPVGAQPIRARRRVARLAGNRPGTSQPGVSQSGGGSAGASLAGEGSASAARGGLWAGLVGAGQAGSAASMASASAPGRAGASRSGGTPSSAGSPSAGLAPGSLLLGQLPRGDLSPGNQLPGSLPTGGWTDASGGRAPAGQPGGGQHGPWSRYWRLATVGAGIAAIVVAALLGSTIYARTLTGSPGSVRQVPTDGPVTQGAQAAGPPATGRAGAFTAPSGGGSAPAGALPGQGPVTGPTPVGGRSAGATGQSRHSGTGSTSKTGTTGTGKTGTGGTSKSGQGSGSGGGTGPTSPPPPTGFRWYTFTAASFGTTGGLVIALPDRWRLTTQGQDVFATAPADGTRIEISLAPFTYSGPVSEARYEQATALAAGDYPGYRKIAINPFQFRGAKAASWRFSWKPPATLRTGAISIVVTLPTAAGPQPYELSVFAVSPAFLLARALFEESLATFRPLPPA